MRLLRKMKSSRCLLSVSQMISQYPLHYSLTPAAVLVDLSFWKRSLGSGVLPKIGFHILSLKKCIDDVFRW